MRRRVDAELVRRGLVGGRRQAVEAIERGQVLVSGTLVTKATRLVGADEALVVQGEPARFVSRGGEKLDAALTFFGLDVRGKRCLDAGASTGGFTDCLLERGAAHVVAADVGRGQLAWELRNDDRVTVIENCNVRYLAPGDVGGVADLVVADLSFISLRLVAPALARLTSPNGFLVLLIKPQFESERVGVGKRGVVRDPAVHLGVLKKVENDLRATGLVMVNVVPSPLKGPAGNAEFLGHFVLAGSLPCAARVDEKQLREVVEAVHQGGVSWAEAQ